LKFARGLFLSPVVVAAKTARPKEPGQNPEQRIPGERERNETSYLAGVGGTISIIGAARKGAIPVVA
jgi:hypothetical protein